MSVGEIPAPHLGHKIGVTPRKRRRIAAVDDIECGRINGVSSGRIESPVTNDCVVVVVGKVEEVLHNEMVAGGGFIIR